jgi:nucleotide-binding universal stress UspA family protein
MYSHILVAVDGSDTSNVALREASSIFDSRFSKLLQQDTLSFCHNPSANRRYTDAFHISM